MRPMTHLLLPLLFALPVMSAQARPFQQTVPIPEPSTDSAHPWCTEHAEQCDRMKVKHEAFCKNNPVSCERMKAQHEQDKQWCKDHPKDCKKLHEERKNMREQRREKMQERCKANPEKCEKMKENFRKNHPKPSKDPA